jgi:hypothetical protein
VDSQLTNHSLRNTGCITSPARETNLSIAEKFGYMYTTVLGIHVQLELIEHITLSSVMSTVHASYIFLVLFSFLCSFYHSYAMESKASVGYVAASSNTRLLLYC